MTKSFALCISLVFLDKMNYIDLVYALFSVVKCNDDAAVLSVLAQLGTGFVCYSKVRLTLIAVSIFIKLLNSSLTEPVWLATYCTLSTQVQLTSQVG
jgi:Pyridoxal-dependent decarboxylase, pyridoxal binding domain